MPFLEKFRKLIDLAVFAAGLLNAVGLAMQALKVYETKDVLSLSAGAFGIFIFIQVAYLLQAIMNKNRPIAVGMVASMIPTFALVGMIYVYGK